MFIGLSRGFVHLDTVTHRVLQLMVGQQSVSHRSIREEFLAHYPDTPNLDSALGNVFVRLRKTAVGKPWKYIYKVGSERDSFGRAYSLYSLYPRTSHASAVEPKLSSLDRCRRYRARKKLRVNSVFNFRGTLRVQEGAEA
jgi:hypothetical protein